jgi:hypothetical protein
LAIYGEWPALLATLGVSLAYVECQGLDWETPDRDRAGVRRVGLTAWRHALDTPAEWHARRALATDIERGFHAAAGRRLFSLCVSRLRIGSDPDLLRVRDAIGEMM